MPSERTEENQPYVFTVRPRCPKCGSLRHSARDSHDQGDGSRLQYKVCLCCGGRFKLVLE